MKKKITKRIMALTLMGSMIIPQSIVFAQEEDTSYMLTMKSSGGGSASIYLSDTSYADEIVSGDGRYMGDVISIKKDSYEEGSTVYVRAIPEPGYYFDGWECSTDVTLSSDTDATTAVTMPGEDITLTAKFAAYSDREKERSSFLDLNGVMWFYNTWFDYKYTDLTAKLDEFKENGINVLGFFCPYAGDKEKYDGCDPLDWYDVPEQCGTLDDFKELVDQAHARDMKVICYFVNIYIDKDSEYFKTAEKQYAAGEYDEKECATFYWAEGTKDEPPAESALPTSKSSVFGTTSPAPFLQPFKTKWEWSETAGAWYCNVWLGGGLNFDMPGAQIAAADAEKFWLDLGMDGFAFDVASPTPSMQDLWVHIPETYTDNDKWLATERGGSVRAEEFSKYGYNCWFNDPTDVDQANDYTRVVGNILGADGKELSLTDDLEVEPIDVDGLEKAFENSDYAHSINCWTYAWSPWGDEAEENLEPHAYPTYKDDETMRVQEAALLAGGGITYGCGMYDQYLTWSDTLRENWGKVLKTVNDNAALLPSADRRRVETVSDDMSYAMIRNAADGSQTSLLVYNLTDKEQTITVETGAAGIGNEAVLRDLYGDTEDRTLSGEEYQVTLPAYGFEMLEVAES